MSYGRQLGGSLGFGAEAPSPDTFRVLSPNLRGRSVQLSDQRPHVSYTVRVSGFEGFRVLEFWGRVSNLTGTFGLGEEFAWGVGFPDEDGRSKEPVVDIRRLVEEDGMVDAFAHFFPDALGRATCWSQQTNGRYRNAGCAG
eukprot:1177467-Prorocentrum_minimum.AAC.4